MEKLPLLDNFPEASMGFHGFSTSILVYPRVSLDFLGSTLIHEVPRYHVLPRWPQKPWRLVPPSGSGSAVGGDAGNIPQKHHDTVVNDGE